MINYKKMGIQNKLTASFTILIILPLLIVGIFSYRRATDVIDKKTTDYYKQSLSQTAQNYSIIFDDIENLSFLLLANDDVRALLNSSSIDSSYFTSYNRLSLLVRNFLLKPYIFSLSISKDSRIYYQAGVNVMKEEKNEWYSKSSELNGSTVWSSSHILGNMLEVSPINAISMYREIVDLDLNQPIGTIRISLSEETLFDIYKNSLTNIPQQIFIVDDKGVVISHSQKDLIGKVSSETEVLELLDKIDNFYDTKISKNRFLFAQKIGNSKYTIINIVPSDVVNYESIVIKNFIIWLLLGCFIFTFFSANIVSFNILKPIKKLSRKMNEVKKGDFNVTVEIDTQDEIGNLALHFNEMVSRIKTLIRELYEEKLKEREAELKALQEQINPHFLYNTLDAIRWTARKNKDFETSEYIEVLSNMMRYNLNNRGHTIDIGSELIHLKDYIFLQEKRNGDKIKIAIDFDEALYSYKIIKLSLQPLVENSFTHGLSQSLEGGNILIKGYINDERIYISVIDDGNGADEESVNEIINSKMDTKKIYALKNINERIKLHFDDEYGLYFKSKKGQGTETTIIIPMILNS